MSDNGGGFGPPFQSEPDPETEFMLAWVNEFYGVSFIEDIVLDLEDANLNDLRGGRYSSAEEAVLDVLSAGIFDFTEIVFYPDEGTYGIVVSYG